MQLLPLACSYCTKIVCRSKQRINESNKFHWKTYCSPSCKNQAKSKQQLFICSNIHCKRSFTRKLNQVKKSINVYCSRSCAASINNARVPKRKASIKICHNCSKSFTALEKYCSITCKIEARTISKDTIIEKIKVFYTLNGRIPLKREFPNTKAARHRFGTWNKAIEAAGFQPNPVKFAKKHFAKDGHCCDSLAEKIIDDFLSKRIIKHERNIPYGINKMTADFKVNDILIEFIGLQGVVKKYDKNLKIKEQYWKEKKLHVIKIYPQDLFPKNNLNQIFSFLLI